MEDCPHDEYTFSECNKALLQETIGKQQNVKSINCAVEWPLFASSEDYWNCGTGAAAPSSGDDTVSDLPLPQMSSPLEHKIEYSEVVTAAAAAEAAVAVCSDYTAYAENSEVTSVPFVLPSSSDLVMTFPRADIAHYPAKPASISCLEHRNGTLSNSELAHLCQLPLDDFTSELQRSAARLQEDANLILISSDERLAEPAARRWLALAAAPRLLAGEVPSAQLATALVTLASRRPAAVANDCLHLLAQAEKLACGDELVQRLVTEGLPPAERVALLRHLGGRPVSGGSITFLMALLPATSFSPGLASDVCAMLAAAADQQRSSTPFARLLLAAARYVGPLLDKTELSRLRAAAHRNETPLRRAVQAALARLSK